MDKIKTVKIKNPDGSVSEESYTISVDARNVDMDNGKELQETIGTIDIDTDGNIGEQLKSLNENFDNLDENVNNLNIDIKKKAYFFNTVADMKNANLKNGDYACTLGYYSVNDGGAGNYFITNVNNLTIDNGAIHQLNNGLFAQLILNEAIYPKQCGCYCDGIHNDTDKFHNCIDLAFSKQLPLYIQGNIKISSAYDLNNDSVLTIVGNGAGVTFNPNYVDGKISKITLNNCDLIDGIDYFNENHTYATLSINLQNVEIVSLTQPTSYETQYYIFKDVYVVGSNINNIGTHYLGLSKGTIGVTTNITNNRFTGVFNFINKGATDYWGVISDSVISNNYISGLNNGSCFESLSTGSLRITNNYIDYFKNIFNNGNYGSTVYSSGNIYDGYFKFINVETGLIGQISSESDKFHPYGKQYCINKGWITAEDTYSSITVNTSKVRGFEFINPKLNSEGSRNDVFIDGTLYGVNHHLAINIVNPMFWNKDLSALGKRCKLTDVLQVQFTSATGADLFNYYDVTYLPSRIDVYDSLPVTKINNNYVIPPFYKCWVNNKLYEFRLLAPDNYYASFVEVE